MIPITIEEIEDYLESLEEFISSSFNAAAPDLPNLREAFNRLWLDVSRFGPPSLSSFPDIHIPGLGDFEVPPPPPPPPPKTWLEHSADWIGQNRWKATGIVVGVVGAGLLAGYGSVQMKYARTRRVKATASNEKRQVVVVLGGDKPLGLALILDLEKKGYIVITSVSTPEAVEALEHKCHGYVRALVLDPNEPGTVPIFLRSLASTLSRRFPINTPGDPYASPSSHPYIHSVVSLLTLVAPSRPAPLEHLSLRNHYLPYFLATHITPLQVLQSLMPLLRTTPARSRDSTSNNSGKKSIIVCIPATDARVGVPFASAQAMSAAATLRGAEVLRREINVAALTDKSDSMKNIKVVVVDVGAVDNGKANGSSALVFSPQDVYRAMEDWTPSEKLAYGAAFSSILQNGIQYGVPRTPTNVAVVVDTIVEVISGGRNSNLFGITFPLGKFRNWIRGERFSVGAGARTYALASHLPGFVLDALINIPHLLISIRNALLPVPPRVAQPFPPPVPPPATAPSSASRKAEDVTSLPMSDPEHTDLDASETGSEADVESNSGDGSAVESSWVSLKTGTSDA